MAEQQQQQGATHFSVPSCSGSCCLHESTAPGGPCVSKGSWPQFVTLPADTNHPGSQEDAVSYWQSPHSLVRDVVSVAKITVAHGCRSRASLPLGRAIKTSWLALPLYSLGTPGSQCGVRAFPWERPCVFLCLSGVPTVWVATSH